MLQIDVPISELDDKAVAEFQGAERREDFYGFIKFNAASRWPSASNA
jgi:hypothetical protein